MLKDLVDRNQYGSAVYDTNCEKKNEIFAITKNIFIFESSKGFLKFGDICESLNSPLIKTVLLLNKEASINLLKVIFKNIIM